MKIKVISLIIILLPIYVKTEAQTPANLFKVATRFISTLSSAEQKLAIYSFDDKKRVLWTMLASKMKATTFTRYSEKPEMILEKIFLSNITASHINKLTPNYFERSTPK